MTNVFKARAVGTPRRQGHYRVGAIERLNRGLLVDAEHGRVLRRVQIQQADHIGRRGVEVRIVGGQRPFPSMRLEGVRGPDTRDRHMREAPQLRRQFARGPVRRPVTRCMFRRPGQDACLNPIGYGIAGKQPRQSIHGKARAPPTDVTAIAVQLGANRGPRQAIGQQQNQTGMPSGIGATIAGSRVALTCHAFMLGQCHHVLHGRHDTTILTVTAH